MGFPRKKEAPLKRGFPSAQTVRRAYYGRQADGINLLRTVVAFALDAPPGDSMAPAGVAALPQIQMTSPLALTRGLTDRTFPARFATLAWRP